MASFKEVIIFLIDPWVFMFGSLAHLPPTILRLLFAGNFSALLSPSRLQIAWFGSFWSVAGPGVRETGKTRVVPLLEGRVKRGKVFPKSDKTVEEGCNRLRGTVLEIGPGTGLWVSLFADTELMSPVSKIYGVEPNCDVHHELEQRVVAAGLSDRYEIVPWGIEDLATSGHIAPESLDCIVSVLCLCSIPEPDKNICELFRYLKPGGTWFVYEHVRCESKMLRKSGLFMRWYQVFVNLFWPHLIGGCQLCRDTSNSLVGAGHWTEIDLEQPEDEPWYHPLPHVLGTLRK